MREITNMIYKFEELSKEAKFKATNDLMDYEDANKEIEENIREELGNYGFHASVVVEFSLSYSQGDGVAFYGKINFETWIKNHAKMLTAEEILFLNRCIEEDDIELETTRNSFGYRYSHAHTMDALVTNYYGDNNDINKVLDKVQNIFKMDVVDMSKKFEKGGYEILEYYSSEEYMKDLCNSNDYEFYSNGELYK